VFLAWVVLLVAVIGLGEAAGGKWLTTDRLPGTDSQKAYDVLARNMPQQNDEQDSVVFTSVPAHRAEIDTWLADAATVPGVTKVGALDLAPNGTGIGRAAFSLTTQHQNSETASALQNKAKSLEHQGVDVAFSGDSFTNGSVPSSEVIGILGALVVLVLTFGSLIAAGLPVLIALAGIGVAIPGVLVLSHLVGMANFTNQVVAMIAIGVGIDYTLLILTRYRTARSAGKGGHDAVVEAVAKGGRAVVLAGATVMVSSLGMSLIGMATFTGLAVGIALGVGLSVAAAITLLPAIIAMLGTRLDPRTTPGRLRRTARFLTGRRRVAHRVATKPSLAGRWAAMVTHRPGRWALGALGVALLLALPFTRLHLGTAGANTDPVGSTTRDAYQLTAKAFGPGTEGPILVVAEGNNLRAQGTTSLTAALAQTPGVASVGPATLSPSGTVAVLDAVPTTGPADRATENLLRHLRHDVVPQLQAETGYQVHLGGETASNIDFATYTSHRLPLFVGAVLVISLLLLVVMLRSVLVPVKALLLNLVSVAAAYGVIVAAFQWGWGASLMGTTAAPIAPWIPVMVFSIVFGLSMDYEVFLVSAIRERWEEGATPGAAVVEGVRATSRLITAAGAIMVLVFGSFVVSNVFALKVLGLGLAFAIAFDATVIRLVLVPAVMTLMGRGSWWFPFGAGRRLSAPAGGRVPETVGANR
jgi:RND superfamily putative drug exporter